MADVVIREYDEETDREAVEQFERMCEAGPSGSSFLVTDTMGDPMCRIRNSPCSMMLVAEIEGNEGVIVGVVRGSIRTITCGSLETDDEDAPIFTKAAYVLGLRVSPAHRRRGIGLNLVKYLEEWFCDSGAKYVYMATDSDNEASVGLFTNCLNYIEFRSATVLVQPVHAHQVHISSSARVFRISPSQAESLYRSKISTVDFFPRDIDAVLSNRLTLGTFLAVPPNYGTSYRSFLANSPPSWAAISIWNVSDVFKLQMLGLSHSKRVLVHAGRLLDQCMPFLRIPSVPDISKPFGGLFLYGLIGEGPDSATMMRGLCDHAHNMGIEYGAGMIIAELASTDPLKEGIPHWTRMSFDDMWLIKRLEEFDSSEDEDEDWSRSSQGTSIFVDPREV